jgi:proteasome assembly chaperone 2
MLRQSRKQAHVDLLINFIQSYKFSAIIILTTLDSAAATTEDHLLSPLQLLLPPSTSSRLPTDLAERLARIPPYVPPTPSTDSPYPPFLPNGGLTRRLLTTLQANSSIPHATLAYWCAEADNRPDAFRYAGIVTYLLGIRESLFSGVEECVLMFLCSGRASEAFGAAELEGFVWRVDWWGVCCF